MTGRAAGNGNALANELDLLRRRAGLSFRDLSKLTGHPVSTLHNALTGWVFPRLETVLSIVRACGEQEAPWRERWADPAQSEGPEPVVPRELPRAPRAFVGSEHEMSRLVALVEREQDRSLDALAGGMLAKSADLQTTFVAAAAVLLLGAASDMAVVCNAGQ